MPRSPNLKNELTIRRLRSEGVTLRAIAQAIGSSPSSVSRTLRIDPNRNTLATQDERLKFLEMKMEVAAEVFTVIANLCLQYHGPNAKARLLEVLIQKWPDTRFKNDLHAGRL